MSKQSEEEEEHISDIHALHVGSEGGLGWVEVGAREVARVCLQIFPHKSDELSALRRNK